MKIIKVLGPTRNRQTTVNIEWNSGKKGTLLIDRGFNITSFGKKLPADIEKNVKAFLLRECPKWINKELERLEIEKNKSLKLLLNSGSKGDLYRANYKIDSYKISALESALYLFKNVKAKVI